MKCQDSEGTWTESYSKGASSDLTFNLLGRMVRGEALGTNGEEKSIEVTWQVHRVHLDRWKPPELPQIAGVPRFPSAGVPHLRDHEVLMSESCS